MGAPLEHAAELETAVEAVVWKEHPLRTSRDPGKFADPPVVFVGPPQLTFGAMDAEPTGATYPVYVIVAANEYAVEDLSDLVLLVAAALDGVLDTAVQRADPTTFPSGGVDLPAYMITTEVDL